jgi:hypothetical protein
VSASTNAPNPMDAAAAFWKDAWGRMATTMPGGTPGGMGAMPGGLPGMPAGMNPADPSTWMPSPDAVKRMQSAFLDAMANFAEQYMRSPQFLEAMRKSMDQGLQLRQQMEQFMKTNMSTAFDAASGGSSSDVIAAIRELESRLGSKLNDLSERISNLEGDEDGKAAAKKSPKKK